MYIFVIARFAAVHKSKILVPSALGEPNPCPPCTPLKPSGAFPYMSIEITTNNYSSGETVEM